MDIQTALNNYKSLGVFFAPDYEQDNEVLSRFKKAYPSLSKYQATQLSDILISVNDFADKYFVADLLYLYDNFDIELLEPLLLTAINYQDPSFNRVFLRPCITAFGTKKVADFLELNFRKANTEARIGISSLVYWLRPRENGEADHLHKTILQHANTTKNLIERYHYKLLYSSKITDGDNIPNSAAELMDAIEGNAEYENLLFDTLKWQRKRNS